MRKLLDAPTLPRTQDNCGKLVAHEHDFTGNVEMVDRLSREKRSKVMSHIRSFGNRTTELRLMQIMKDHGIIGWRRHLPLPGRPDFAFKAEKVAVFVDGCFWHGCPRCYQAPTSNASFWAEKLAGNRTRDKRITSELRAVGWGVLRLWEHDLRHADRVAARLQRALRRPPERHS
jgi:DNA mismatch endonuclease, patch repair protein